MSNTLKSGRMYRVLDAILDTRQEDPNRLKIKVFTDTASPVNSSIDKIGGTDLTGDDWTQRFKALNDDTVKGLLRSIGDAGTSPANTTGKTVLQLLTEVLNILNKFQFDNVNYLKISSRHLLEVNDDIVNNSQIFYIPSGIDTAFNNLTVNGKITVAGNLKCFTSLDINGIVDIEANGVVDIGG